MANNYDLGDLVRVSGSFSNEDGMAADPNAIFCAVRNPAGIVTTYQYGVDDELVRDDTGEYHLDINANSAGYWYYRWYSTGTGQAADEEKFYVIQNMAA